MRRPRLRAATNFGDWMRKVDWFCRKLGGVSVHDLPDCLYRDWYGRGMIPLTAAKKALKGAGW